MTIDWTGVVALLGALLTLFASIVALLPLAVSRTEEVTAPLDPLIKVNEIKRNGLGQHVWDRRRGRIIDAYRTVIPYFVVTFIVYPIVVLRTLRLPSYFQGLFPWFVLIIAIYSLVTIYITQSLTYLRPLSEIRFKQAEDAKYYVFESAEIEVNGKEGDIFCKAQEALRGKRGLPIYSNIDTKTMDVCLKGSYIVSKAPVKIKVALEPSKRSKPDTNDHLLTISYEREENKSKDLYDRANLRDIDTYSAFANQFIGLLVTTQAPSEKK